MTDDPHATSETQLPAAESLSYEAARDELVTIVARLESGQLGLEESMTLWERGETLADHCTRWLDGAQARLRRADDGDGPANDNDNDKPDPQV